ncbi:MAG: hypothetical protein QXF90_08530 [Thermofilaceae archaeon]
MDPLYLPPHLQPELRVEVAERLVEEQDSPLDYESSGKRYSPLLPTAQLERVPVFEPL